MTRHRRLEGKGAYLYNEHTMKEYIDARNLPNPQPLVYTKRALATGEFSHLIVHVNNEAARESVVRFARHAGFPVSKVEQSGEEFYITIENSDEPADGSQKQPEEERRYELSRERAAEEPRGGELSGILMILGAGEYEGLLLRTFISLPSSSPLPSHILVTGILLEKLVQDTGLRSAAEGLFATGVRIIAEREAAGALAGTLPSHIDLLSSQDITELILRVGRVITL